jgi:hypothetical protein
MPRSQPFELDPAAFQEIADRLSNAVAARILEILNERGSARSQPVRRNGSMRWRSRAGSGCPASGCTSTPRSWEPPDWAADADRGSGFPERSLGRLPAELAPVPQPAPVPARTAGLIPIHPD